MHIHVSPSLDQNQQICRRISFYDLVELLTFGRLFFDRSAGIRPGASLSSIPHHPMMPGMATSRLPGPAGDIALRTPAAPARVAYQTWTLLTHEHAMDWGSDDTAASAIHIVSTIGALADALFVSKGCDVLIEQTSRVACAPAQLHAPDAAVVPILDDDTLAVTVWPRDDMTASDPRLALRLPVDLNMLLMLVLVSPRASSRFVELVSGLVQRICYARVARANLLRESSVTASAWAHSA